MAYTNKQINRILHIQDFLGTAIFYQRYIVNMIIKNLMLVI